MGEKTIIRAKVLKFLVSQDRFEKWIKTVDFLLRKAHIQTKFLINNPVIKVFAWILD